LKLGERNSGMPAAGPRRRMLLRGWLTLLLLTLVAVASVDWLVRTLAGGESRAAADPLAVTRPTRPSRA